MLVHVFYFAVCLIVLASYCPCACALWHRIRSAIVRCLRRPMEPTMPSRPARPETEPDRAVTRFHSLLNTEANLIESAAFKHVNNVAVLRRSQIPEPHYALFGVDPDTLPSVATYEWNENNEIGKPALTYTLNENGTINTVLHH